MSAKGTAVRAGFRRSAIELRQMFTDPQGLAALFLFPALIMVALFFMRNGSFQDTGLDLAVLALPGVMGTIVFFNGIYIIGEAIVLDREDGTLLRAKATPNGTIGYFIGRIGSNASAVTVQVVAILVAGCIIVGGVELSDTASWFTLVWVVVLGLLATLPLGAALGAIVGTARGLFFVTMPLMLVVAISGIFYPITALPGWLQVVAQILPCYWLGLGLRSALLPDSTVMVEIDQSWRHLETVGVLGAWAIVGLLVAPIVLSRMARNESGSKVDERREKALARAY
ncbi:ABC transporter permease [Rhodococcus sp. BP-252]|uniref:ABC transporter permease n=1 Tax=unclassified Rhodococcus (in: high G+C Gram-positive bacteria) TaxID=192944 RepID=UPI001C9B7F76|nr:MULTISPECIES: ABC transporter permease [unclassified Rhodococcus (in: high G+C Gram-positive bacteria)]MBY6411951.1 ABC transporter permease [Rhodococcus sp. BP-320]MBY6416421.1 ABC transporter permease [Rhodococcus sp. BP-321]MBY6420773.1 ABC transporter permease [Rhodococcus sp. BP-324]MBY6426445.1 ABC transporter permease [Rhodococcus sp. BP-323]MBY6431444.1 ABC transporter permease [Rhodococcus sp. BP-322]